MRTHPNRNFPAVSLSTVRAIKTKTPHLAAAALVFLCAGCGKTPEPKKFLEAWNAAVLAKDPSALLNLFAKDSRGKVVTALQKSKARADADKDFKQLFAAINPSIDLSLAPEEMAKRALGLQLGGVLDPHIDIKTDTSGTVLASQQESTKMAVEGGEWRAAIGCVGFAMPDGAAVTLAFAWPVPGPNNGAKASPGKPLPVATAGNAGGQVVASSYFETRNGGKRAMIEAPDTEQPALTVVRTEKDSKGGDISKMSEAQLDEALVDNRLVPDALDSFRVHIDPNGLTPAEMSYGYEQIARRIAKLANLPEAYALQAAKVMDYYESVIFADGPDNKPYDVEFALGVDGSLTATHWVYNRTTRAKDKDEHPRLTFGALSGAP